MVNVLGAQLRDRLTGMPVPILLLGACEEHTLDLAALIGEADRIDRRTVEAGCFLHLGGGDDSTSARALSDPAAVPVISIAITTVLPLPVAIVNAIRKRPGF